MDSQGAAHQSHFDFGAVDLAFTMPQQPFGAVGKASNGGDNTSPAFFFADEGIDTTTTGDALSQQAFDSIFPEFNMSQSLGLNNTSGTASWVHHTVGVNNTFPPTPTQSFDSMYTPQLTTNAMGKRPLQLDVHDFPQPKRHEGLPTTDLSFSPYPMSVTGSSSWTVDTQPTPASSADPIGLSDEAADVCATWFSKYNVLPSDRHIDSLSQLTGESATAIRQWFGQALKQGLGHDSAYKSQTVGFTQDALFHHTSQTVPEAIDQTVIPDLPALPNTQAVAAISQGPLRGGRKGCNPTDDPELLKRDSNKIYQCTRKCGKRYGRKCDWKRNEEEGYPSKSWICSLCIEQGVDRVKPCFRKYHFSQHFRNVHPGIDCNLFEETSVVHSDTAFPKKCGFCTHRFVSRQDRIDHIADHFKDGKSMLEWDDNDNNDSDNTDDDDDNNDGRPDGGDSSDDQSFFPPGKDDQTGGSGPKDGGNGGGGGRSGNSSSGEQNLDASFFQFQLAQDITANPDCGKLDDGALIRPDKPCVPSAPRPQSESSTEAGSIQKMLISSYLGEDNASLQTSLLHDTVTEAFNQDLEEIPQHPGRKRSVEQLSVREKPLSAKGVDSKIVARDAFSQSIMRVSNSVDINRESPDGTKLDSDSKSAVRALNALLTLLNPMIRAPPDLPPPLISSGSSGDSSKSWLVSERSFLEGFITSRNTVVKSSSTSSQAASPLQVQLPSLALASRRELTDKQQYWKGITTLLDQQSFLSIKLLGTGGFSTVDEVLHRETGLQISRKTLKNRRQSAFEELKKEVDVLQKLRHPHVIRFLGAYAKDDKMSILLAPVAETTLARWLDQKSIERPAGLTETIVSMLGCLSSTLRYLHEQRPVVKHMDIKPQNILVMQGSQEFPHVVLSDFGISSIEKAKQDSKHKPITRQYCAPEVSKGTDGEPTADIWSLGCVFAEMATVAFSTDSPSWRDFQDQFRGRNSIYYWQDIVALQDWLTKFFEESSSPTEAIVAQTVKSMLNANPAERPDAAMLSMIFTPAPCCLSWPNEQASYPGPQQERECANMYAHDLDPEHPVRLGESVSGEPEKYAQISTWLHECSSEHEACRHEERLSGTKALPTRLIDIRPDGVEGATVRILDTAQLKEIAVPYAVLSYTWGRDDVTLTSERLDANKLDIPRNSLAADLENGIATLQRIGFRYAWVDSLCVFQDSAADKERECMATADVYRNADVTVLLDRSDTSPQPETKPELGGCSGMSRSCSDEAKKSSWTVPSKSHLHAEGRKPFQWGTPGFSWDTRAWSLQERLLSRRILHLNEPQAYWECNELKASETFPRGLPPLLWEKVHTKAADALATTSLFRDDRVLNMKFEYAGSAADNALLVVTDMLEPTTEVKGGSNYHTPAAKRLKTCQWVKQEGDGIGDSMEAAQMSLSLHTSVAANATNVNLNEFDEQEELAPLPSPGQLPAQEASIFIDSQDRNDLLCSYDMAISNLDIDNEVRPPAKRGDAIIDATNEGCRSQSRFAVNMSLFLEAEEEDAKCSTSVDFTCNDGKTLGEENGKLNDGGNGKGAKAGNKNGNGNGRNVMMMDDEEEEFFGIR